jgi:hypothetical protein
VASYPSYARASTSSPPPPYGWEGACASPPPILFDSPSTRRVEVLPEVWSSEFKRALVALLTLLLLEHYLWSVDLP